MGARRLTRAHRGGAASGRPRSCPGVEQPSHYDVHRVTDAARILYVGHATVRIELDGARLLTDPVLRRHVVHLRRVSRVENAVVDEVDVVLLSHLHYDHLDIASLRQLDPEVRIVVPSGAKRFLERKGFSVVHELGVGEELVVEPLTIRATPAAHGSGSAPFRPRVDPIGFRIMGTRSIYFAGDTDLFDSMGSLGPVDVALLPIAGWGPSLGPGHMNAEIAADAARLLQARIVIPIHWGTYYPAHLGIRGVPWFVNAPGEAFARLNLQGTEIRVLQPGEETEI